jgi:tetratricopeptide (TPR) repeat protein
MPAAYVVEGIAVDARGDTRGAIDRFTKAEQMATAKGIASHYVEPLSRRANAYEELGQYDQALADTDQILKLGHKDVDTRLQRANIFTVRGDPASAAAEAEAMMRENPKDEYAFVAAAKTFAALGQPDKAMAAFDRAIAVHPYGYIYLNREQVRPWSGVTDRLADLDAGLKVDPDNPAIQMEKARLLVRSGNAKGALDILDRVKRDPDDLRAGVERAVLLYKAGRTGDATSLLQQLHSQAKSAQLLNALCWAQATEDVMLDAALQDCREALKLDPSAGSYLDSLGMVLLKLGKLDEALQAYNEAIAKEHGAASLMGRSFVYRRKGDQARADADAAAARRLSHGIDDTFADYGLTTATPASTGTTAAAK